MSAQILTQERLQELLKYDPSTGQFVWRIDRRGAARKGTVAGGRHVSGYIEIRVDKKRYKAHRLAFLYMEGVFPPAQTDHINHVRDDNRWDNLRAVTCSENQRNAQQRVDNASGCTGVNWHKTTNKWAVHIRANGRQIWGGVFTNLQEAIGRRKELERQHDYHANHGT